MYELLMEVEYGSLDPVVVAFSLNQTVGDCAALATEKIKDFAEEGVKVLNFVCTLPLVEDNLRTDI